MRQQRTTKFKERLEEMVKKYRNDSSGDSALSNVNPHNPLAATEDQPATQSAQPPEGDEFKWVSVDSIPPPYYKTVHVWNGKEVRYNWHRLWSEQAESDFFAKGNRVDFDVTHWSPRKGEIVPEYQPMTSDDIPLYTQRDINGIILNLRALKDKRERFEPTGFHMTINQAIDVIETHTKEVCNTREQKHIKIIPVNDTKQMIKDINNLYQYMDESGSPYGAGYNNALKRCIDLIEQRVKQT